MNKMKQKFKIKAENVDVEVVVNVKVDDHDETMFTPEQFKERVQKIQDSIVTGLRTVYNKDQIIAKRIWM